MNASYAQLIADFSTTKSMGCAPLSAAFVDHSIGGSISYRKWDFGNGNISVGNVLTPSVIYLVPGVYTIALTISDGVDTNTIVKTNWIQVVPKPVANIVVSDTMGCVPFQFHVSDMSQTGSVPVVQWEWDFHDGSIPDTNQSGQHTYLQDGAYAVGLKITDSLGCVGFDSLPFQLIASRPKAQYLSSLPTSSCNTPMIVELVNTSIGVGALSSVWNLNAQVYTTTDLNTVITGTGLNNLELAITDSLGCVDTLFNANCFQITGSQYVMNSSDTVCPGQTENFSLSSTKAGTYIWDFGNAAQLSGRSVDFSFKHSGTYPISVYATDHGGCQDTIHKVIQVDSVQAGFISYPNYSCASPMVVKFIDNSSGNIYAHKWKLGSGKKALGSNVLDTLYSAGIYNDTLEVTSAFGCSSMAVKLANDTLEIVDAVFAMDRFDGCVPLTVNFQNLTSNAAKIKDVVWNFDLVNGTIATTKKTSPSNTFTKAGVYVVELQVTLFNGCVSTSSQTIYVGNQPIAAFSIDTNYACASKKVGFTNASVKRKLINYYLWSFGDNTYSNQFEPLHAFKDTGLLDVSLVVGHNGCFDTARVDSAIYIASPILSFGSQVDCTQPNHMSFLPNANGATSVIWQFGDGSPFLSNAGIVNHVYAPIDSNYLVRYAGFDSVSGCNYSAEKLVKVRYLSGKLRVTDSVVCKGEMVDVNTLRSINSTSKVMWAKDGKQNWTRGGRGFRTSFTTNGKHDLFAVVFDENGCTDTLNTQVSVFKPIARIASNNQIGCSPLNVNFSDASVSDTNLISWNWNFGDGTSSALRNPTKVFTSLGNKNLKIELTVTDTFGCTSKIKRKKYIKVKHPRAEYSVLNTEHCFGDSLNLAPVLGNDSVYLWNFGDGTQQSGKNPSKAYAHSGSFLVELTVIDHFGCADTFTSGNPVIVHAIPNADFSVNDSIKYCYPAGIIFTNTTATPVTDSWEWVFGDGDTSFLNGSNTVFHNFTSPGVFDISLRTRSQFGCVDSSSLSQMVTIKGPTAEILTDRNSGCLKNYFEFGLTNVNSSAFSFKWDYGDGVLDTVYNSTIPVLHKYNHQMQYNVTLLVSDSLGFCVKTDQVTVDLINVEAVIEAIDTVGCHPVQLEFKNVSQNTEDQYWTVGNTRNIVGSRLNYEFLEPGTYEVNLEVWNDSLLCRDTVTQEIIVHESPVLDISKDTTICSYDQTQLFARGADSLSWYPGYGVHDSGSSNPITEIKESTQFRVTGVSAMGCITVDSVFIDVIQKPVLVSFPTDTSVFEGQDLSVLVDSDSPINLKWQSEEYMSCDDCFDPYVSPNNTANYILEYEDEFQCFTQDTSFRVELLDYSVFVPNSFSPNNDGLNDEFIPVTVGVSELMYMYVYDNWGKLVFETTDLEMGWDGTVNGNPVSPNSMFTYKIKVVGESSRTSELIGTVAVVGF